MSDTGSADMPSRPYRILLASDEDWTRRSLESVLEPSGFAVLHARHSDTAIDLAHAQNPEAVILGPKTADMAGLEVCRVLRGDAGFPATTPIILIASHALTRSDRLDAYGAGAWDVCNEPLDLGILLLKLQTFVRAKRRSDRLTESNLIDGDTGFYNMKGLRLRAREMSAEAARRREPLVCAALSAFFGEIDAPHKDSKAVSAIANAAGMLRAKARNSDIVGHIGNGDFLILAGATDEKGAETLLIRLREALLSGGASDRNSMPAIEVKTAVVCVSADTPADTGVDLLTTAAYEVRARPMNATGPSSY